jgi:hypothetical protein
MLSKACERNPVCSLGCFNKCNTNRKAVRLPIPGSCDISLTAFSINFEENSMKAKVINLYRTYVTENLKI